MHVLRRLVLLSFLLAWAVPVRAQSAAQASITHIDATAFPQVSLALNVVDENGARVPGLAASAFAVTENGASVSGLNVGEESLGVQLVIVLNAGSSFPRRDSIGRTRLQVIEKSIADWAATALRNGVDDVSVLTPEGVLATHAFRVEDLTEPLLAYTTTARDETPDLALLQQGIAFALDPTPRPGMRRVVLFISSALDRVRDQELEQVASLARGSSVTVHTAYVGPTGSEGIYGAQRVRRLAELAGGQFAFVDFDAESLLPIYDWVSDARMQYVLEYRSRAAASGNVRVDVTVQTGAGSLAADPMEYTLVIEPPSVDFENLPAHLTRSMSPVPDSPGDLQTVRVSIEFPDGHPRGLSRSVLFVDGQPVAERTSPPFETFEWTLGDYTASGTHQLAVAVVDELGLEGQSKIAEVSVEVVTPSALEMASANPDLARYAVLATLAVAALGTGAVALVTSRRRVATPDADGTVAPVLEAKHARPKPRPVKKPVPATSMPGTGKAYLEFIRGGEGAIELLEPITRLGRDPGVAQAVFADRSVSRLHARLAKVGEWEFHIYDEGSTSGTWVNYEQIPMAGARLSHGDLINLGRVQLRFQLRSAAHAGPGPQPVAKPVPPSDIPTGPTLPVKPPERTQNRSSERP